MGRSGLVLDLIALCSANSRPAFAVVRPDWQAPGFESPAGAGALTRFRVLHRQARPMACAFPALSSGRQGCAPPIHP